MGRLLTRKLNADAPTRFEWDGMDCVREVSPSGVETLYYVVNGELISFERGGVVYTVHSDALGSVRKVTDSTGAVVATFDADVWGNELPSTDDGVPGGFQYRALAGSLGVRLDETSGLYYMRYRWYDPTLQRFIGRDPVGFENAYPYAANCPSVFIDPSGLTPLSELKQTYDQLVRLKSTLLAKANTPGSNYTGLDAFCDLMRATSRAVDTELDFLKVLQALTISNKRLRQGTSLFSRMVVGPSLLQTDEEGYQFFPPSGMDPAFLDRRDPSSDQVHHLVAFMRLGHVFKPEAAKKAVRRVDDPSENAADVMLGDLGVEFGFKMRNATCSDREGYINDLCAILKDASLLQR